MGSTFSAGPQALGYLYQARVALFLLLQCPDDSKIRLESLDDIEIKNDASSKKLTLTQLKHHIKKESELTDYSSDLWKSIRVWAQQIKDASFLLEDTRFFLLTTSTSPPGSIASMLGVTDRNPTVAKARLLSVINDSTSSSLKQSFEAFKLLTSNEQEALVSSITILDSQSNIDECKDRIKQKIRPSVKKDQVESLYERLEGWWFDRVVLNLLKPDELPFITAFDLHEKTASIAQSLHIDDLPIDFGNLEVDEGFTSICQEKLFIGQLREIKAKQRAIEKAILDYYRAFHQKSRWLSDGLITPDELISYESKLIDEWERYFDSIYDDSIESTEAELISIGKEILQWAEFKCLVKIRPRVEADFIRRGSFHILADKEPEPAIYWHPKFKEKVLSTIATAASQ